MRGFLPRLATRLSGRYRRRRASLFRELMRPGPGATILDLGGGDGAFMASMLDGTRARVTVADLSEQPLEARDRFGFEGVVLEERRPLPFADGEFDIVFCNSVIEHVTLPKEECRRRWREREWRARARASQSAFAAEIRRVGRSYFVQTPHRHFPIEPHTWLPLVNWLGHNATVALVNVTDRHWVKKCHVADWQLLTPRDMRRLFPEARIHVERVAGVPRSIIAYMAVRN